MYVGVFFMHTQSTLGDREEWNIRDVDEAAAASPRQDTSMQQNGACQATQALCEPSLRPPKLTLSMLSQRGGILRHPSGHVCLVSHAHGKALEHV